MDPGCLERVANLLSQCIDHHTCFETNDGNNFIPDRLLNVGNEKSNPFLETHPNQNKSTEWVALSYCWGKNCPSQKLTISSADKLRNGVPLQHFDATIRDAILVTRSLGIKYIWVDALCIFQDEGSPDWPKQSSSMADIYGCAKVTLIPLDSATTSSGFLHKRAISYISVPWTLSEFHCTPFSDQKICVSDSHLGDEKIQGPWTKRAWTMQEGLLSNRQIIFTSSQIIWRCRNNITFECGVTLNAREEIVTDLHGEGARGRYGVLVTSPKSNISTGMWTNLGAKSITCGTSCSKITPRGSLVSTAIVSTQLLALQQSSGT